MKKETSSSNKFKNSIRKYKKKQTTKEVKELKLEKSGKIKDRPAGSTTQTKTKTKNNQNNTITPGNCVTTWTQGTCTTIETINSTSPPSHKSCESQKHIETKPISQIYDVKLKLLCLVGDAKTQQLNSGSNSGSSDHRCYSCFVGVQSEKGEVLWYDLSQGAKLTRPTRTIAESYLRYRELKILDSEKALREAPRPSCLLPLGVSMSEMESFMDDHHIWSLWVTVDPLHVVEGHSVELMKWIVSKSSQHETQEMSHYLCDYCHSSFSPTARPGWKWRLVWASFPVTWDAVYPTDSLAHQLVLTWSLCCGFMYSSAENRNWKGWFKFLVLALKHFIFCRQYRSSSLHHFFQTGFLVLGK